MRDELIVGEGQPGRATYTAGSAWVRASEGESPPRSKIQGNSIV